MNTNAVEDISLGLNHVPWLQQEILGNQLWQYAVLFVYILLAVLITKVIDVVIKRYLKRWAERTRTRLDDRLVEVVHGPLRLSVFVMLLHLGMKPVNKPDWLQEYLNHGFGIIVAIAITYVVVKLVDFGFEVAKERIKRDDPRAQDAILVLIRKAVKIFVIVTAVLVTADNNGIKVGGIIASLGITGLAVALAAQETLSNLLGSIVILADRPFFLGDRVKIVADEGTVEHIGIRSTRLRTTDGDVITIPNRTVAASTVRNYSKTTQQLTEKKAG